MSWILRPHYLKLLNICAIRAACLYSFIWNLSNLFFYKNTVLKSRIKYHTSAGFINSFWKFTRFVIIYEETDIQMFSYEEFRLIAGKEEIFASAVGYLDISQRIKNGSNEI